MERGTHAAGGPAARALRVDLHLHTNHSPDAWMRPAELIERAIAAGLDRFAVTDHDTLDGALAAYELDPSRVIVGQEIGCRCGTELIGLFLREEIPRRLPFEEAVERIRAQGGVIYAPHPFAYARQARARAERALAAADIVEVYNSRAFLPRWNRLAMRAARARGLPVAASSDGHFPWELGRAYTEIPHFAGPASFLEAARDARPVAVEAATPFVHLASLGLKAARLAARAPARLRPAQPAAARG